MSKQTIPLRTAELFDLTHTLARPWLEHTEYPWEILSEIPTIIRTLGESLDPAEYHHPAEGIWIAKTATVAPTAHIGAPAIIGEHTEVRQGAFIRGGALVGEGCVVGNSTELKNCILFDGVQVPHYNYVGDSVLGYKSHLGAGVITSNVKSDKTPVTIKPVADCEGAFDPISTGRKKLGAILGDFVEVGCNTVLNPGTVIGAHTNIYPLSSVRGAVPAGGHFQERRRGEDYGETVSGREFSRALNRKKSPFPSNSVKSHKNPFPHGMNIVFFNLFKSPLDVI